MINVVITCTLGQDAELRTVGQSEVLEFRAASNAFVSGAETTTWLRVSFWGGRRATTLAPMLKKGTNVMVRGELYTREYADRSGATRSAIEVRADAVELGPKRAADAGVATGAQRNGNGGRHRTIHAPPADDFGSDIGTQNEIPF